MRLHVTLYIAGAVTPRSSLAKRRLDQLVEQLDAEVVVDVVDVLEDPHLAERERVFATPTLVREVPPPGRRVIGDLAGADEVAALLGVEQFLRRPARPASA